MNGRRVAVFGAGRSGESTAKAAAARGARVTVYDEKPASEIPDRERRTLENLNISISSGFDSNWDPKDVDVVVVSPGVSKFHPKLLAAVQQGIPVISEVEFAFRIAEARIVAITGTNGKSTTTVMTHLCLQHAGFDSVLCGNIYGSGYPEIPLTEAAATAPSSRILVAEISSFQLEWIDEFRPIAATITNIEDDHLNRYEDFDDYASTKRRVFQNMGAGDTAVWRVGDVRTEPPRYANLDVLGYGEKGSHAWTDRDGLHFGSATMNLQTLPFFEKHNFENAMAAVLLAFGAVQRGIDTAVLMGGLRDFRSLEHRMERLGERGGVLLVNNSMCTNPAAVVASSMGLPMRQHLLVGGVDKNMDFAPLREYLEQSVHAVYVFGSSGQDIARQLGASTPVFNSMAEAFEAAARAARSGEAVMLAPGAASTDQFKDFRDRGESFREIARMWLES